MGKPEWRDIAGNEIHVGDIVVYPTMRGDSPILRYGLVVRLAERKDKWGLDKKVYPTIRVRSVEGWEKYVLSEKEVTIGELRKLLIVGGKAAPPPVPAFVRELFETVKLDA